MVILGFTMLLLTCQGKELEPQIVLESQLQLFDWDGIKELETKLKESVPEARDFQLVEEVKKIVTGETQFSIENLIRKAGEIFLKETGAYIGIIIRFILIAIMCSLLQTLSQSFKSKETTKIAFLVCYLFVIYTVSQSLLVIVELANQMIGQLSEIMMVTLPTLLAFMAVSGYITSSSALAAVIIGTLNVMTLAVKYFVLPFVVGLIVLQIIGTMSDEIKIDKWVKLFYKMVKKGLRWIFVVSMGIMGIYKMTLPLVDVAIKKSAISLSTSFIPVIGDVSRGALEFILSCAQLVKNSFALGVVIWIVIVVSVPLIKLVAYAALYHVAGAIIQPIGDKKMSDIATILASGCEFVLSCTSTIVLLTIVVMLVCASVGISIT